jgi:peptidoglycan hydrolase CwlO-like protein
MARPLPLPDPHRTGVNGNHLTRPLPAGPMHFHSAVIDEGQAPADGLDLEPIEAPRPPAAGTHAGQVTIPRNHLDPVEAAELQHLRGENEQLRALCLELEQALQEAAQQISPDLGQQVREYEAIIEEKNEVIRQLHQKMEDLQAALQAQEARAAEAPPQRPSSGPAPCEEELLALSEELERERRQLQEDEQSLMEQMRQMEVSMARERAEMARQRNDLQRLQSEIRHELERLERQGALQSKIDGLKNKLQDVTARRGAAPATAQSPGPIPQTPTPAPATRKEGLMGRLFGQK